MVGFPKMLVAVHPEINLTTTSMKPDKACKFLEAPWFVVLIFPGNLKLNLN